MKIWLELFNHLTLKATENTKGDEQKFHIFKTLCVGDIFKSILSKLIINIVGFDIFGIYLCIWSLLNNSGYIVNNFFMVYFQQFVIYFQQFVMMNFSTYDLEHYNHTYLRI